MLAEKVGQPRQLVPDVRLVVILIQFAVSQRAAELDPSENLVAESAAKTLYRAVQVFAERVKRCEVFARSDDRFGRFGPRFFI